MVHRAFRISSSWNFFDQEKKIKNLLLKNLYSSYLIDKEIKKILDNKITAKENTNINHNNKSVSYCKLAYIGSYSNSTKKKKKNYELWKTFCNNANVKTVFSPFKLQDLFFLKRYFASCSEVLCCVQIYLCRMLIVLHWGHQAPFTNKDQGTSANWYKISHSSTPEWES